MGRSFYKKLSKGEKISINQSLNNSIKNFLKDYRWDLSNFKSHKEIIDNIHIYWFLGLSNSRYIWCSFLKEEYFDSDFVREVKGKIEIKYNKMIRKRKIKNGEAS